MPFPCEAAKGENVILHKGKIISSFCFLKDKHCISIYRPIEILCSTRSDHMVGSVTTTWPAFHSITQSGLNPTTTTLSFQKDHYWKQSANNNHNKTPKRCWVHRFLLVLLIHEQWHRLWQTRHGCHQPPSKIFTQIKHSARILSHPHCVAWGRHHKPYRLLLVHHLGHLLSLTFSSTSHSLRWIQRVDLSNHSVVFYLHVFHIFLPLSHCPVLEPAQQKPKVNPDKQKENKIAHVQNVSGIKEQLKMLLLVLRNNSKFGEYAFSLSWQEFNQINITLMSVH